MKSIIKINADFYLKMPEKNCETDKMKELLPFVNIDMLDLREKDDFENMLQILFAVCGNTTARVFLNPSNSEILKSNHEIKLDLLKRGFIKNKE
ncbi:MAG TPA: hypothetical protein DCR71_02120 [Dehalococcoidia bacterium]|nr:hypothetical protein [Dehalococcoidia bacterium]